MRMDKRAEGSFAETMMAMMVVTVALTVFMSVFAYSLSTDEEEQRISTDFLDSLRVEDGEITGIDESYVQEECVRKGYTSMVIRIETAGDINKASLSLGGSSDSDFTFVRGTTSIPCDDGTTVLASYEVVAFA